MKTHTTAFKNQIKEYGRELDSIITYTQNEDTIELGNEELNSITPAYEGSILKSVMKQLTVNSNVDIPIGTELNYQLGVKVRDENVEDYRDNYDYINFGNYIVKDVEKNEDTLTYNIKCYDKMLYAMEEYDEKQMLEITYPITIRNYINILASKLGLVFKNASDTFVNYNKEIKEELFLSKQVEQVEEEGVMTENISYVSLEYTYRDILDQLAQATASTICINEEDDELEIRYINDTNDTIDEEYLKDVNVKFGQIYGPINSIVLSRSAESDNLALPDEESVEENGLCEIKIIDNQIMNFDDREDYMEGILNKLDGLTYSINDFSSTGICYYNLCDKYSISRDNTIYECIMFNDEILITQGLQENIHTNLPEDSETDYSKTDKTDRRINQALLIVNKQENTINALVKTVEEQNNTLNQVTVDINSTMFSVNAMQQEIDEGIENAKTLKNTMMEIDAGGIHVLTEGDPIETLITNKVFSIKENGNELAFFGYRDNETKAVINNLNVGTYFRTGVHRFETFTTPDTNEERTGVFYIGGGN